MRAHQARHFILTTGQNKWTGKHKHWVIKIEAVGHTVPGEGERADIEDDENIGDQFGKTRQDAERERGGWRGIRFHEAERRG